MKLREYIKLFPEQEMLSAALNMIGMVATPDVRSDHLEVKDDIHHVTHIIVPGRDPKIDMFVDGERKWLSVDDDDKIGDWEFEFLEQEV